MQQPLLETIVQAVARHPEQMSPMLLTYLLRGEPVARLAQKGLMESPFHGACRELAPSAIAMAISDAEASGWIARPRVGYAALRLTSRAGAALAAPPEPPLPMPTADTAYRLYYSWRQAVATRRRTPAYRIVPNRLLYAIASRVPTTLAELLLVPGLGKRRALRYQAELLALGRAVQLAREVEAGVATGAAGSTQEVRHA